MEKLQTPWYLAWNGPVSDAMVSSTEWTSFRHHGI